MPPRVDSGEGCPEESSPGSIPIHSYHHRITHRAHMGIQGVETMPKLRSATTTHGRNMAGARALWRATGMTDQDFGKPIIAVVNSFTQFVPGHVHLKDLGQLVAREIEAAGGRCQGVQHHRRG